MYKRKTGQSTVELVAGLFILVPIVLVLFDLAVIVIAVQINDQTCRQAARAAASGNPATATARANAIISRANSQGSSMLSNFSLNGPIIFDPTDVVAQAAALEPYGGTVTGTVSVNTQVEVRPFIVPYVYSGGAPLIFNSGQSFPFTFVVPNTATPGP